MLLGYCQDGYHSLRLGNIQLASIYTCSIIVERETKLEKKWPQFSLQLYKKDVLVQMKIKKMTY